MKTIVWRRVLLSVYLFSLVSTRDLRLEENVLEGENAEWITKIVGGYDAPQGKFPWMVALYNLKRPSCSSFIVSNRTIITAAHCVVDANGPIHPSSFVAKVGNVDREKADILISFEEVIVHPNYGNFYANDIALMTTKETIQFGKHVQPLCVKGRSTKPDNPQEAIAMGWGRTNIKDLNNYPDVLKYTPLSIIDKKLCGISSEDERKLCASGRTSAVCEGDSGGPLVQYKDKTTPMAVGITSYGHDRTCRHGNPVVYTRLDNYQDFIEKNVETNVIC